MARSQSRTHTSIWRNDDFLARTGAAQRMYWLLYSQQTITLCGVIAYTPKRWESFASDQTTASVETALMELERNHYIVIDHETEELFVRSFMRNDGVHPGNPKLWKSAMDHADAVLSPKIRHAIGLEKERIQAPEGVSDTASDTPQDGLRAYACAASSSSSTSTPTSTPTSSSSNEDDEEQLRQGLFLLAKREMDAQVSAGNVIAVPGRWLTATCEERRIRHASEIAELPSGLTALEIADLLEPAPGAEIADPESERKQLVVRLSIVEDANVGGEFDDEVAELRRKIGEMSLSS